MTTEKTVPNTLGTTLSRKSTRKEVTGQWTCKNFFHFWAVGRKRGEKKITMVNSGRKQGNSEDHHDRAFQYERVHSL